MGTCTSRNSDSIVVAPTPYSTTHSDYDVVSNNKRDCGLHFNFPLSQPEISARPRKTLGATMSELQPEDHARQQTPSATALNDRVRRQYLTPSLFKNMSLLYGNRNGIMTYTAEYPDIDLETQRSQCDTLVTATSNVDTTDAAADPLQPTTFPHTHAKGTQRPSTCLVTSLQKGNDTTTMWAREKRRQLAALSSPFTFNLLHAFQTKTRLYMVQDGAHCTISLRDVLKHGLAPKVVEDAGLLRHCVASAVAAIHDMHASGVVHGNISLDTIMISQCGDVRLALFRPEMLSSSCDLWSCAWHIDDWYHLGVALFEFLTGVMPYPDTVAGVAWRKSTRKVFPPRKIRALSDSMGIMQGRKYQIAYQKHNAPPGVLQRYEALGMCSSSLQNFVLSLLLENSRYRLGIQGASEVMEHPWLSDITWNEFMTGRGQRLSFPFPLPTLRKAVSFTDHQDDEAMVPISRRTRVRNFDYRGFHVVPSRTRRIVAKHNPPKRFSSTATADAPCCSGGDSYRLFRSDEFRLSTSRIEALYNVSTSVLSSTGDDIGLSRQVLVSEELCCPPVLGQVSLQNRPVRKPVCKPVCKPVWFPGVVE